MRTISTLLSRSAAASVIALLGATCYIHLAEAHAQDAAAHFCSAVQSGEDAAQVRAMAQTAGDKSIFTLGKHGVSVMFGHSQRYVCDVRFNEERVTAKAVTQID